MWRAVMLGILVLAGASRPVQAQQMTRAAPFDQSPALVIRPVDSATNVSEEALRGDRVRERRDMRVAGLADSIHARQSYWLPGAVVGGVLGFGLGESLSCIDGCHHWDSQDVLGVVSLTFAVGVIGALIGSSIHHN